VTRSGFGALATTSLAAACLVGGLVWLGIGPEGAQACSSAGPIAPKEAEAPVERVAPEGIEVSDAPAQPIRLAANEAPVAPPVEAAATEPAATAPAARPGLLQVDTDSPLSIKADELEAIEDPKGGRKLVFNRSVNVDQGGLSVRSSRLEAYYPPNASQPDRLVASGSVRVRQKTRELSCATATYYPAQERLECVGNAMLRDGANQVSGERIEILFAQDRIRVKGGAVVNVAPDAKKKAPAAGASADAPRQGATP
jgi:lipopolysaccharide transport protein LptA